MSVTRARRWGRDQRRARTAALGIAGGAVMLAACSDAPRPFNELPAGTVAQSETDCTPPPAATGMQRYNILDVYPGLPVSEARRRLSCAMPSAAIAALNWIVPEAKGLNKPDTFRLTQETSIDRMESVLFEVDGFGPEARVLRIQRLERFARPTAPRLASIQQSLRAKYGEPDPVSALPVGRSLSWRYAPGSDQRLPEAAYGQCQPVVGGSVFTAKRGHAGVCGLTVLAEIETFPGNELLVESVRVSVWDMGASPAQSDRVRQTLEEAVSKAGRSENKAESEREDRSALTARF